MQVKDTVSVTGNTVFIITTNSTIETKGPERDHDIDEGNKFFGVDWRATLLLGSEMNC